jgi:hypothetical protein
MMHLFVLGDDDQARPKAESKFTLIGAHSCTPFMLIGFPLPHVCSHMYSCMLGRYLRNVGGLLAGWSIFRVGGAVIGLLGNWIHLINPMAL